MHLDNMGVETLERLQILGRLSHKEKPDFLKLQNSD